MRAVAFAILAILSSTAAHAYSDESRGEAGILRPYRPIYVLFGRPDTKIQLSGKVQVLRSGELYLGYTQLAFWELGTDSTPMRDIDFNPDLFYRFGFGRGSLDVSPFEHESNGRSGDASRSWNRAYVRYSSWVPLDSEGPFRLDWSFKLAAPFDRGSNSGELPEYRGIWELNLSLVGFFNKVFDRSDLSLRLYPGGNFYINPLKGGQELTLRMNARIRPEVSVITFQVFHGFAENLLDFKDEHLGLRFGVGF